MRDNIWFSRRITLNCAKQQWRRRNPSEAGIPLTCMQSQQQWPRPCMNEFPGATVTWETIVHRVQPSASLGVECRCILRTDIRTCNGPRCEPIGRPCNGRSRITWTRTKLTCISSATLPSPSIDELFACCEQPKINRQLLLKIDRAKLNYSSDVNIIFIVRTDAVICIWVSWHLGFKILDRLKKEYINWVLFKSKDIHIFFFLHRG